MPEDEGQEEVEEAEEAPEGPSLEERLARLEAGSTRQTRQELLSRVVPQEVLASGVGQFFAEHYAGGLTEADVRAAAQQVGLLGESASDQAGTASAEERAAHEAARDLSTGSEPQGGELGPHPNEMAREAATATRRNQSNDDALGAYIESRFVSAASGDPRGTTTVRELLARQR